MKRLFALLLFIILFISCTKLFKEDDRNELILKSDDDFVNASNALYNLFIHSVVVGDDNINSLLYSIGNGDDLSLFNVFSEALCENSDIVCPFTLESTMFDAVSDCGQIGGTVRLGSSDISILYKNFFKTIGCANDFLSKAECISDLSDIKKEIIGEIYFIRAYCYFRLARTYGQVPIVNNPDVSYSLKKPSFVELYNFIEKDLLKAIELLPKTKSKVRIPYETPSSGTAKAILAEVYLTMGGYPVYDNSKYADAAKIAGELINSSSDYGFGLVSDLADLWNGTQIKNIESVFSFYNMRMSLNYYCVPRVFYNKFPKGYRKEMTFQTRHVPYIIKYVLDTIKGYEISEIDSLYIKHYDTINNNTQINYKKFYSEINIPDSLLLKAVSSLPLNYYRSNFCHYNGVVYLLRYAQVLLTYSEAKARSGNLDESAYNAINMVRRRANKSDISSPSPYDLKPGLTAEQFADSVVYERAWELCAEPEGRWFDLVRLNMAKNLIQLKDSQNIVIYPIPIDRATYFLPIPEEDKILNPNLE